MEEERVLAQDRGTQGFRGHGGLVPGILVHAPTELGSDAFAERAVAAFGEVDAVVGTEVEGDTLGLPLRLDERHILFRGEFGEAASVGSEQGVVFGRIG